MAWQPHRQNVADHFKELVLGTNGINFREAIRPFNPVSHSIYRGGNFLNLSLEQASKNSDDPRWMTFNQAQAAGFHIRKGAKAANVEYYDFIKEPAPLPEPEPDEDGVIPDPPEEPEMITKVVVYYARVFNGTDIVGLPEYKHQDAREYDSSEVVTKLLSAATKSEVIPALLEGKFYDASVEALKTSTSNEASFKKMEALHYELVESAVNAVMPSVTEARGELPEDQISLRKFLARDALISTLGLSFEYFDISAPTEEQKQAWSDLIDTNRHDLIRAARDADVAVGKIVALDSSLKLDISERYQPNLVDKEQVNENKYAEIAEGKWDELSKKVKWTFEETVSDAYFQASSPIKPSSTEQKAAQIFAEKICIVTKPAFITTFSCLIADAKNTDMFCSVLVNEVGKYAKDYASLWQRVGRVNSHMEELVKSNEKLGIDSLTALQDMLERSIRPKFDRLMLNNYQLVDSKRSSDNDEMSKKFDAIIFGETGLFFANEKTGLSFKDVIHSIDEVNLLLKHHGVEQIHEAAMDAMAESEDIYISAADLFSQPENNGAVVEEEEIAAFSTDGLEDEMIL